ncbi:WhiB family transcriptional regulator [Streptomyces sp. NPDC048182]|uniref:WhiB family transcriptional regulator n=1 Tax=unclassified Streptomyces TaxID=2593676 RepID=UPI0033B13EA3
MHLDTIATPALAWQQEALCAQTGADFFFPEPGSSVREAKRICALCAIRPACLEYALGNDERFGVWGGLSEKERLALRRAAD